MFERFFRKNTDDANRKKNIGSSLAIALREKSAKALDFCSKNIFVVKSEFFNIKQKLNNLLETNYTLGMKHLERGNLTDATFRFAFIKKFWPDYFDAYYQLAYCLTLNKKLFKARAVLQDLLSKKPDYDQKARDLLERINLTINAQ